MSERKDTSIALAADVLVVGAGPTGLTAAAEALRHGLSVRIVDTNDARTPFSKALVAHSRTLEVFTDMGFAARVVSRGTEFRALDIHGKSERMARIVFAELDWQDAPYPFWLSIPQSETERCLEEHLEALGGKVERRTELTHLEQRPDFVRATLRREDGETATEHYAWVVGCDGARSAVRKLLGIAYEGTAEDEVFILGDVTIDWDIPENEGQNFLAADGILLVVPMPEPRRWRVIAHMPELRADADKLAITEELLQTLLTERTGMTARLSDVGWSSQFSVKHLVAAHHRLGRAFLAGDAAHVHSPVGGQGLNTGVQDAYNLMWKLALVQRGQATEKLLESYHAERHAVAEATIKNISRATALVTLHNPLSQALRNQLGSLLINTAAARNRLGPEVGMLNISYRGSPVVAETLPELALRDRVARRLAGGEQLSFASGPSAGDRAPSVSFTQPGATPGDKRRLLDTLCGGRHTLLLFVGLDASEAAPHLVEAAKVVQRRYAAPTHVVLIVPGPLTPPAMPATPATPATTASDASLLVDVDGAIHRRYGADTESLYLVRPDLHVGYRSQPIDLGALTAYLDTLLIAASP